MSPENGQGEQMVGGADQDARVHLDRGGRLAELSFFQVF
jgi:hypothetical protein